MTTVLGIYLFILIGFFSKKIFKEIEGKTLVLLSTYFLQPFLTLWGIMLIPLDKIILTPFVYIVAVFVALIFTFLVSYSLSGKERTIASLMPLIGNTGNLGIPLNLALFGDIGASIATIINLANVFFIYSFGIFFFAKSEYSFKESFKKIVKIPIMWVGILAIFLNLSGVKFSEEVTHILQMGAYASIVIQLLIFGIYFAGFQIKEVPFKLTFITTLNKFLIFPLVGFVVLKLFGVKGLFFKAVLIEILTPLAVTNVNLAALFNLYPEKVAFLVLVTSLLFLGVVFVI